MPQSTFIKLHLLCLPSSSFQQRKCLLRFSIITATAASNGIGHQSEKLAELHKSKGYLRLGRAAGQTHWFGVELKPKMIQVWEVVGRVFPLVFCWNHSTNRAKSQSQTCAISRTGRRMLMFTWWYVHQWSPFGREASPYRTWGGRGGAHNGATGFARVHCLYLLVLLVLMLVSACTCLYFLYLLVLFGAFGDYCTCLVLLLYLCSFFHALRTAF